MTTRKLRKADPEELEEYNKPSAYENIIVGIGVAAYLAVIVFCLYIIFTL
jgi:hypothetical protein